MNRLQDDQPGALTESLILLPLMGYLRSALVLTRTNIGDGVLNGWSLFTTAFSFALSGLIYMATWREILLGWGWWPGFVDTWAATSLCLGYVMFIGFARDHLKERRAGMSVTPSHYLGDLAGNPGFNHSKDKQQSEQALVFVIGLAGLFVAPAAGVHLLGSWVVLAFVEWSTGREERRQVRAFRDERGVAAHHAELAAESDPRARHREEWARVEPVRRPRS